MNYPEYVRIGEKKYKINTDFRIAIECQEIATDENIGDLERLQCSCLENPMDRGAWVGCSPWGR